MMNDDVNKEWIVTGLIWSDRGVPLTCPTTIAADKSSSCVSLILFPFLCLGYPIQGIQP